MPRDQGACVTRWAWTLNNYSEGDLEVVQAWDCAWMVYGKEIAPTTGTPHLQGAVIWKKKKYLTGCKKMHPTARFSPMKGTPEQNLVYCTKEDPSAFVKGTIPDGGALGGQAQIDRWAEAKRLAKEGKIDDIDSELYVKYYNTFQRIAKDHMPKPEDATDVTGVWIWGPPGSGKSRKARAEYPNSYYKMQNKWWDGYQGEETVILDDLDCKELGHLLKIWTDRYSFICEAKGGALHIRPKKIVITSNYPPDSLVFGWDPNMVQAITRRCEIIFLGYENGLQEEAETTQAQDY